MEFEGKSIRFAGMELSVAITKPWSFQTGSFSFIAQLLIWDSEICGFFPSCLENRQVFMLKDKTVRKQGWFSLRRMEQCVSLFCLSVMKLLCKILHSLQSLQVQVVLLPLAVAASSCNSSSVHRVCCRMCGLCLEQLWKLSCGTKAAPAVSLLSSESSDLLKIRFLITLERQVETDLRSMLTCKSTLHKK